MEPDLSKINGALKTLKKQMGDQVITKEEDLKGNIKMLLDSPNLNYIFGGRFTRGRVYEFLGLESSGKSLIATAIGANFQRKGEFIVYVDLEYTFDHEFARKMGLITSEDKFLLVTPSSGEDTFTVVEELAKTGQIGWFIIDSVAAISADAEQNNEMGDSLMAVNSRLIGKGLRRLIPILFHQENKPSVGLINQVRSDLGAFKTPDKGTGGKSIPFFSSVRTKFLKPEDIMQGDKLIGQKIRMKNIKNKTGPSKRATEVIVYFDGGLDYTSEYIDRGIDMGLIEKGGAWLTLPNGERFQGKVKATTYLKDNPEYLKEFKDKLDKAMSNAPENLGKEVDEMESADNKK